MDPTQTLINIIESLNNMVCPYCDGTDRENAVESLDNLSAWLQRGGFPPDVKTILSTIEI